MPVVPSRTDSGSAPARRVAALAAVLVGAALAAATGAGDAAAGPCGATPPPDAPSPDLYCVPLLPVPALRRASGMVEMRRVASPFGIAVGPDGEPLYDLIVSVDDLPPPSALGPFAAYVAWAATPVLSPVVKLGPVRGGEVAPARISFPKFLVLVTAEISDTVSERRGRIALRGTSPSMRAQPHDLARLMASLTGVTEMPGEGAAGRGEGNGADGAEAAGGAGGAGRAARGGARHGGVGHEAGGGAGPGREAEWTLPPPHPRVLAIPAMAAHLPDVAPFLPHGADRTADGGEAGAAGIPDARPREIVELADGDTLALVAGLVRRTIGGRTLTMYGFNGQHPGPLIRVPQDAVIVVEFENRLDLPTSVHWHGVRLENRFDGAVGVTQEAVPPGGRFTYRVRFPDAGIYWYHPHHREDIQQELGLYGNLLVRPARPGYWGPANREETLILDDLLIGVAGLVPFGAERATHALMGRFGNVLLVNGEPQHRLEVRRGEVVRFFLTNAASTRTFNLGVDGAELKVVGTDLGRFEREERVGTVVLAPAERYVVEALFDRPGEHRITNRVQGFDHALGTIFPEVDTLGVVRVLEEAVGEDHSAAFHRLRADAATSAEIGRYRRHLDRPVDRELILSLELGEMPFATEWMLRLDSAYFNPAEWSGTMPMMNWASTGRHVRWIVRDPATGRENEEIDDWRFRVGDVVKVRITNERRTLHAMQHPIHIHGQRFLVLAQSGVRNENLAWKDTMLLPVGATAVILLELSNPGTWMLHCHIAEHLEAGMRMVFTVEP